jgi:hypothetical protein
MTSTSIGTEITSVRIRLREPGFPPPTLQDFGQLFENIESLVFVSAVLARIDPDDDRDLEPNGFMISPDVLVSAQHTVNGFRVGGVSYSSPIEILLYGFVPAVTVGLPTTFMAIKKIVKLWQETSDARVKQAEARIKESEARLKESDVDVLLALNNRKLRALSMAASGSNLDRVDPDAVERKALGKPLRQRVEEAGVVLLNAEEIIVEQGLT